MSLPLTKDTLASAYEYLRTTPPFKSWNLPDSEDVKFVVSNSRHNVGRHWMEGSDHVIEASRRLIGHTHTLMALISHEMVHIYMDENDIDCGKGERSHNAAFNKLSARVCKIHGFDPRMF